MSRLALRRRMRMPLQSGILGDCTPSSTMGTAVSRREFDSPLLRLAPCLILLTAVRIPVPTLRSL